MLNKMRSAQTSKALVHRGKWTIDVRTTVLVAIAWILVALLFAFFAKAPREEGWPLIQGTVQDTRIVPNHAVETKWGGQVTWKAEYLVSYHVGNRGYTVWADSGIRSESEDGVRFLLPQHAPKCRVQYKPQRPEVATANCR